MSEQWQNRIISLDNVPAHELLANVHNARRHPAKQREALRGSLDALGYVAPVLVNKNTGYLIDGHARVEEQLTKDENGLVPVLYVDLTEDEEKLFLATFDWVTTLATYDQDALNELLHQVNTDEPRLQAMLSDMAQELNLAIPSEFKEYDTDVANEVEMCACPNCGHEFPK